MGYESCHEKYKSYFSPELKEIFIENSLTLPYILEFAEEQCDDTTCKHHIFYANEDGQRRYGENGTLSVNPDKQQDVPFVKQCHGCMCLLNLIEILPSPIDIANAFGLNRKGVGKHLNSALRKVRKKLQINP